MFNGKDPLLPYVRPDRRLRKEAKIIRLAKWLKFPSNYSNVKGGDNMADNEVVPKIGDEFGYRDDEGEYQTGIIAEVQALDPEDGMWPIISKNGGEYRVYWSDDDDCWTDEEA